MKITRRIKIAFVLAICFTIMEITGYQIAMMYGTTVHTSAFFQKIGVLGPLQCVILLLVGVSVWTAIIWWIFGLLDKRTGKSTEENCSGKYYQWKERIAKELQKKKIWILMGISLFLIWCVSLYAVYPGYYNYDAQGQLGQAMYPEVQYTTFHPMLHTFIMGKIITFGYRLSHENLMTGVFLFNIFQMSVCASCFTGALNFVWKNTRSVGLTILGFCYYAFFPTITLFTMSTTKDVPCALAGIFVMIGFYKCYENPKSFFASPGKVLGLTVATVLMCMFRKNCIYAIVVLAVILILRKSEYRKKLLLLFFGIFLICYLFDSFLFVSLKAKKSGKAETLSVPAQQISRVYVEKGEDAFTDEELELLRECFTLEDFQFYNPFISDEIKNRLRADAIWSDKRWEYFSLWLQVGIRYPEQYVKSFLDNTYQFWYPSTSITQGEEEFAYFDFDGYHDAIDKIKNIPRLYRFYKKISYKYSYQKIPVVRLLFSQGAMLWFLLFVFSYGVYRRDERVCVSIGMVLLYCATVLWGPVMLVRYFLILFFGFPISLAILLPAKRIQMESR